MRREGGGGGGGARQSCGGAGAPERRAQGEGPRAPDGVQGAGRRAHGAGVARNSPACQASSCAYRRHVQIGALGAAFASLLVLARLRRESLLPCLGLCSRLC